MGSASSAGDPPPPCQQVASTSRGGNLHKQKAATRKQRRGSNSSDNGGFDVTPAAPKPVMGVKERLRSSFDKISLKTPFKWSSSDRLPSHLNLFHHNQSKSGKNKNNRRCSDSQADHHVTAQQAPPPLSAAAKLQTAAGNNHNNGRMSAGELDADQKSRAYRNKGRAQQQQQRNHHQSATSRSNLYLKQPRHGADTASNKSDSELTRLRAGRDYANVTSSSSVASSSKKKPSRQRLDPLLVGKQLDLKPPRSTVKTSHGETARYEMSFPKTSKAETTSGDRQPSHGETSRYQTSRDENGHYEMSYAAQKPKSATPNVDTSDYETISSRGKPAHYEPLRADESSYYVTSAGEKCYYGTPNGETSYYGTPDGGKPYYGTPNGEKSYSGPADGETSYYARAGREPSRYQANGETSYYGAPDGQMSRAAAEAPPHYESIASYGSSDVIVTSSSSRGAAKWLRPPASNSSYTLSSTLSGSCDTLQSSSTVRNRDVMVTSSTSPHCFEPPKLAPVSGKLMLNQKLESTIVRPTAFKPVSSGLHPSPPTGLISHPSPSSGLISSPLVVREITSSVSSSEMLMAVGSPSLQPSHTITPPSYQDHKTNSSPAGTNSDSGRNSSTSIPVPVHQAHRNAAGGGSCSASEGYDSARVSTSHSNQPEMEISCAEASPQISAKFSGDDVIISDLEGRIKEREGELQVMRRKFEAQEKTLSKVCEERRSLNDEPVFDRRNYPTPSPRLPAHQPDGGKPDASRRVDDDVVRELRARIDASEAEMQQRRGEISHLKRQIKQLQHEVAAKTNESVAARVRTRNLSARVAQRDRQVAQLAARLDERDAEVAELERRAADRERYLTAAESGEELRARVRQAEEKCYEQQRQFELDRSKWLDDKSRVVRYQKQLQENYVQMFKRSRGLEEKVKELTERLKQFDALRDSPQPDTNLSYPMEI